MAVEARELAERLRFAAIDDTARIWEGDSLPLLLAESVELLTETMCADDCCKLTPKRDWLRRVADATEGGEGHER